MDEGWGRRGRCVPVIVGGHVQSPPTVSLGGQEERDGPSSQPGFIWVRPLAGEVSSCIPGDKWTISMGREGERERFLHFNLGQGCPSEAARGLGGAGGQNPRGVSGGGGSEAKDKMPRLSLLAPVQPLPGLHSFSLSLLILPSPCPPLLPSLFPLSPWTPFLLPPEGADEP